MEGDFGGFDRNRRYEFSGQPTTREDMSHFFRPADRPTMTRPKASTTNYMGGHPSYGQQPMWENNNMPAHDPYASLKPTPLIMPRNDMNPYAVTAPPQAPAEYYSRYPDHQGPMGYMPEGIEDSYYARANSGYNPVQMPGGRMMTSQQQPAGPRYMAPPPNMPPLNMHMQQFVDSYRGMKSSPTYGGGGGGGGSNAQGRAINKHLLDILRDRVVDGQRLDMLIDTYVERMDCVNLATLLFHTGKKRLVLIPPYVRRVAQRLLMLKEELRAREASNALYGLKCLSSDIPEVRELVHALATKISASNSDFVAQAVGNALYGLQMMTSEYEEVRFLLLVLASKVSRCTELLEAQNVGNALYGMRGMNSDHKEVRLMVAAITPKVASAREELNGQALGNSLYGLQCMSSKEPEVRCLLQVLAAKVSRTWEDLKAQEVGNALYGLKRMSTDVAEVRAVIAALVPKIAQSPDVLDAQAVGNSLYGLQNMRSDSPEVLSLLAVLGDKINVSCAELDGQAMGNSLYGLQGMSSDFPEVRCALAALTVKIQSSCLEMNAQELGNALYGLHNMSSSYKEVRKVIGALAHKVAASKHELTSQEIGNALFGLQNMTSEHPETRMLLQHLTHKIVQSHTVLDPQGVSNSLFGLQRMSSECVEVKHIAHALAYKVEHCWKLLGAHHIANACFGMQHLSSEDKEVRLLLKSLVPKVVSCREEMNAKQLSHALFGLHKMTSAHSEVLSLVAALAEKVSMSSDTWNSHYLALALFGLQGLASTSEEVVFLLNTLNHKCSLTSLVDMDPTMLGNCFYGLQRFDSSHKEVCKLLMVLVAPLLNLVQYKVKIPATVAANVIFGIHGMSAHHEPVRTVLEVAAQLLTEVTESSANLPSLRHEAATEAFQESLCLYQASAVSIHSLPDLDCYADLKGMLEERLGKLFQVVEQNSRLYQARSLTVAETVAAQEISRALNREPFVIRTGSLVFGFEVPVFIQLSPNMELKSATGAAFNPVLGVDIIGSSYGCPAKELFQSLRSSFLEQQRGIPMRALPADSFRAPGQGGVWRHVNVFGPLLASPEDMVAISNQLSLRNSTSNTYMSCITSADDTMRFGANPAGGFAQQPPQQPQQGRAVNEYLDDDFVRQTNEYVDASIRYHRRPMGVLMGWQGEWPRINSSPLVHMLSMHSFYGRAAAAGHPTGFPVSNSNAPTPTAHHSRMMESSKRAERTALDKGMMPVPEGYPIDKTYHLRTQTVEYPACHSSDATVMMEGHVPMRMRAPDDGTESSPDSRRSLKHRGTSISTAGGSSHSLTGGFSRSYSQFPTDDVPRTDTIKYDATGHFLAPETTDHSNSFTLSNQNYSQFPAKSLPVPRKQRAPSEVSDVDHVVVPVTNMGDLFGLEPAKDSSGSSASSVDGERGLTKQIEDDHLAEDDDIALLQAQMEMAKLEAKIKSLQSKKAAQPLTKPTVSSN